LRGLPVSFVPFVQITATRLRLLAKVMGASWKRAAA
jgi:hypothetical protein